MLEKLILAGAILTLGSTAGLPEEAANDLAEAVLDFFDKIAPLIDEYPEAFDKISERIGAAGKDNPLKITFLKITDKEENGF